MSLTRTLAIGLVGGILSVTSYLAYLVYIVIVELMAIPSGGLDAETGGTNQNEVDAFLILGYLAFMFGMTILIRALIRVLVRPTGSGIAPRLLITFAAVLAFLPAPVLMAVYWVTVHGRPVPGRTALEIGVALLLVALCVWSLLLRSTARRATPPG
jgi:hypothetical protein